jgi:hypothetical protein
LSNGPINDFLPCCTLATLFDGSDAGADAGDPVVGSTDVSISSVV